MAKVHILAVPSDTFAEILTRPDLEFLNHLTTLYFWNHFDNYKLIVRKEYPEVLLHQLELHKLSYFYIQVDPTF